jgi:hypothetical protein
MVCNQLDLRHTGRFRSCSGAACLGMDAGGRAAACGFRLGERNAGRERDCCRVVAARVVRLRRLAGRPQRDGTRVDEREPGRAVRQRSRRSRYGRFRRHRRRRPCHIHHSREGSFLPRRRDAVRRRAYAGQRAPAASAGAGRSPDVGANERGAAQRRAAAAGAEPQFRRLRLPRLFAPSACALAYQRQGSGGGDRCRRRREPFPPPRGC